MSMSGLFDAEKKPIKPVSFGLLFFLTLCLGSLLFGYFVIFKPNPDFGRADVNLKGQAKADALAALDKPGLEALRMALMKKLETAPLDIDALIYLAQTNALLGNIAMSEQLTIAAANRSYRESEPQLNAVNYYYNRQDFDAMLRHLNGLLVSRPEAYAELLPLISGGVARSEPGVLALAKMLKSGVPWEKPFFQQFFTSDQNGNASYALLNGLRKQGFVADAEVLRILISGLVAQKRFDLANYIWLDFLSERALLESRRVFDGGFKLEPQNMAFDWTFRPFKSGKAAVTQRPGASSDRVMRVDFANSTEFFAHVSQILRLPEGKYTASGEAKLANLVSDGGLTWRVLCLEPYSLLGESAAFIGDAEWSNFSFEINVPATCKTQQLQLESTRNIARDIQISGTVFFDNLEIQ